MKFLICQCCGQTFPVDFSGTRRDHSFNKEYCISCYKDGEFADNSLTMHALEVKLTRSAKKNEQMTLEEAELIKRKLPYLKRWKMNWR